MRALVLVAAALMAGGCSDSNGTQFLPVGSRCSSASQCGTTPFGCDTTETGGYCTEPCTTDGDCPLDSLCDHAHTCRRKCTVSADCRESEGYACTPLSTKTAVCEPGTASPVDLGPPSG